MEDFKNVAPCVGAWIETFWRLPLRRKRPSLPAWERGLKRRSGVYLNCSSRPIVVHGQRRVDFLAHGFNAIMRHNLQHLHVGQGVHCRATPIDV